MRINTLTLAIIAVFCGLAHGSEESQNMAYVKDTAILLNRYSEFLTQKAEQMEGTSRLPILLQATRSDQTALEIIDSANMIERITPLDAGQARWKQRLWRQLQMLCEEQRQSIDPSLVNWKSSQQNPVRISPPRRRTEGKNVPESVLRQIKKKAALHHPLSPDTQAFATKREIAAYKAIQTYSNSEIARSDLFKIKKRARDEWPHDYVLQLNDINYQVRCGIELRDYTDNRVSDSFVREVKSSMARKYPGDFWKQLFYVKDEVQRKIKHQSRPRRLAPPPPAFGPK